MVLSSAFLGCGLISKWHRLWLIRNDSCWCCFWDLQGRHWDCGTWNFQAWTYYESSSPFIVMMCSKLAKGFLQSLIPVVMSGIIAVYGLVVSVLIAGARKSEDLECILILIWSLWTVKPHDYSLFAGFIHLGAGMACGATGLAAGYAIGHIGDSVIIVFFSVNVLHAKPLKSVCTSLCLWI